MPFLTQPAHKPAGSAVEAPAEAAAAGDGAEEEDSEDESAAAGGKKGKKGGKAKGGKGGKGKGKGKGKEEKGKAEEEEEESGELAVIDEIWPKKEALGLTKWYVRPPSYLVCLAVRTHDMLQSASGRQPGT